MRSLLQHQAPLKTPISFLPKKLKKAIKREWTKTVLNYLKKKHPQSFSLAFNITTELVSRFEGKDFSSLSINAPQLRDFDWSCYFNCSLIRMLKVADLLTKLDGKLKILDVGSYFGNFSLLCAQLGHSVDVVDSYQEYGKIFDIVLSDFSKNKIAIHDFSSVGYDLKGLPPESYDVVLCLGVIEHIPHTPRHLMESLCSVLKRGGHLILETPNLAYISHRQNLSKGISFHPPLPLQYFTEIPFTGHHREYTIEEIRWILQQNKLSEIVLDTYSYSFYSSLLTFRYNILNYLRMAINKTSRELIVALAKKM